MFSFWFLIFLMTLLALGLVIYPLLKIHCTSTITQPQIEVALYRDQLNELEQQLKSGQISATDYQISLQELDQALLEETALRGQRPKQSRLNVIPAKAGIQVLLRWIPAFVGMTKFWIASSQTSRNDVFAKRWALLLLIAFPIMAITLYLHWGSEQKISQWLYVQNQQQIAQQDIAKFGSIEKLIATLQQRVQQTPDNAQGWYLLGKLYLNQAQYQQAVNALAKANQLKPNRVEIILPYAESLFLLHQGKLDKQSSALITQVLQTQPANTNAINLLALDAYHRSDYRQAILNWQKLLTIFPANSAEATQVATMISSAKQQMQQRTLIKIPVKVIIAKKLQVKLSPHDSVFVYAKAVNGPAMPLAVLKVRVKDLTKPLALSNNNSMLTNISMQDYTQIQIFARVSRSGQAMQQKGDLQGESNIINPRQQRSLVTITINKIL